MMTNKLLLEWNYLFSLFLAFVYFLGIVVENLNYSGSTEGEHKPKQARKLTAIKKLSLTLLKFRLNPKLKDVFRFGLSPSQTSRYLTTWTCFLSASQRARLDADCIQQVSWTLPLKKSTPTLMT